MAAGRLKRLLRRLYKISPPDSLIPASWCDKGYGQGRITTSTYPEADDIADAHRYMEANKNTGKIVVEVSAGY